MLAEDQHPVGALGSGGADKPFREGSRRACSMWSGSPGPGGRQSATCLVRYPMQRAASLEPDSTPWASNRSPNRATCTGSSGGGLPHEERETPKTCTAKRGENGREDKRRNNDERYYPAQCMSARHSRGHGRGSVGGVLANETEADPE